VADYEAIEEGDAIEVKGLRGQLTPGGTVTATLIKADGTRKDLALGNSMTKRDIEMVLKGGRLA
jgi:aconitase A